MKLSEAELTLGAALYLAEEQPCSLTLTDMKQRITRWLDEEHYGDCTKVPATCNRCLAEEFLANARFVFETVPELLTPAGVAALKETD